MINLHNVHVKLLAFDFSAPSPQSKRPIFLLQKKAFPSHALKRSDSSSPGKFLRFTIYDGTGCIPCVHWLNNLSSSYFSKRSPSGVRTIAQVAAKFASQIQIGVVARVRGRITGYRGVVQVTVSDVVLEIDPNAQVLHWLDCVRLERKCYSNNWVR